MLMIIKLPAIYEEEEKEAFGFSGIREMRLGEYVVNNMTRGQ